MLVYFILFQRYLKLSSFKFFFYSACVIFTVLSSNSLIMRIRWFVIVLNIQWDYPGNASGQEPTCQCRRHKRYRFCPWVRKIRWRRKGQPTPVFLPGEPPWAVEPGGLQSMWSHRVRHDWATNTLVVNT